MSDENRDYQEPQEEAELSDEELEQAAGGVHGGDGGCIPDPIKIPPVWSPPTE